MPKVTAAMEEHQRAYKYIQMAAKEERLMGMGKQECKMHVSRQSGSK